MKEFLNLSIAYSKGGIHLFLDNKEIQGVTKYLIESTDEYGVAELSIKLLVNYPVNQESVS